MTRFENWNVSYCSVATRVDLVQPRQDPAVDRLGAGRRRDRVGVGAEQHQPRRVPELVRERAALVDHALGEPHVLRRAHLQRARSGSRRRRTGRSGRAGRRRCRATSTCGGRRRAWIVEWMYTSVNGMSPANSMPVKIIRATQRLMMSRAVDSTLPGYQRRSSGVSSGQPSVANGHSADENHVSSTSVGLLPAVARRAGRPGRRSVPSGANQTGRRWPHQSWREMHQGRIDSIQSKKIFSSRFGWNVMRPLRTASIAVARELLHRQNHCSETSGSTRAPERWQKPTEWCSGSSRDDPALARSCGHRRLVALARARAPPSPASGRAAGPARP